MSINQEQFRILHDQYRHRLVNSLTAFAGNRDEAEDVAATAFATAYEKRESFRGSSSPYTWVYAIAVNEMKSRRRQKQSVSLDSMDGPCPKELAETDVLTQAIADAEGSTKLRNALFGVPAKYRRTLVDHFVHDHSVKSIAKQQQIPVGTVLSRIFTAKQMLRKAWESGA